MASKNQLGYLFLEAARGFRSDKFLSATSVIIIGICAAVLALLLTAVTVVRNLHARHASESVIRVFVSGRAEDAASLNGLRARLRGLPGADSAVFVSKDRALAEFRRDFGDEMTRSLGWNPLPHSFLVYPAPGYRSAAQNRLMRERIRLIREVEEVSGDSPYLIWLDKWKLPIELGSFLLMAFAAGAMALIIHNAVNLSLHSRRVLVENMKYCGAGEGFILTPFLIEGVFLGLCGGLLGVAALAGLVGILNFAGPGISGNAPFWPPAFAILAAAVTVAAAASVSTVRRFLRGVAA